MTPRQGPRPALTARQVFIEQIRESGTLPSAADTEVAVSAVMCTLSLHLTQGEACDVLQSLPGDIQSLLQPCMIHRDPHAMRFDSEQFFRIVAEHLRVSEEQAEALSRVIFGEIKKWIPDKEIKDVEAQLPKDLKRAWRAA